MKLKLLTLQAVLILVMTATLSADTLSNFLITTNQAVEVEKKLNEYEKGKISIQDLNEDASVEENRELIGYYLLHTNELSLKSKLAVARSYMAFGMYAETVKLTAEYLNVHPNDFHAWNVLGTSYLYLKSPDKAIEAYTNAVRLGDKKTYIALAGAAIYGDEWNIVRSVVPQLTSLKKLKLSPDEKHDLAAILLSYSVRANRKDMFVENFNELDVKDIMLTRDDLKQVVMYGCKQFKGKDIDKIREELRAAEATDSVTNAPSP